MDKTYQNNQARNIIDTRWVLKWKYVIPTESELKKDPKLTTKKTIRARLTVRGFKDSEKENVDRYAGTSNRSSQKLLVSEAVIQGWKIYSADISKAFLQGVTYEELAQLTGD